MSIQRSGCVLILILASLASNTVSAESALGDVDSLRRLPLASFVDITSLEQLADMVVTDTKVAQSLDTVTQKIAVLHGADIDRLPDVNRNLAELLSYTSGQFVNVLSRNDANWGSYAGLGPKYNSYLLDGLPIDSFVDAMGLDVAAIERVEVYKGPASVLYSNYLTMDFAGNETPLAGTTNFVLKNRIDQPLTRLALGTGSYNTHAEMAI
jgi:outer membrane receptor protein involved in Fe transport